MNTEKFNGWELTYLAPGISFINTGELSADVVSKLNDEFDLVLPVEFYETKAEFDKVCETRIPKDSWSNYSSCKHKYLLTTASWYVVIRAVYYDNVSNRWCITVDGFNSIKRKVYVNINLVDFGNDISDCDISKDEYTIYLEVETNLNNILSLKK